ncbi:MAG: hypothetical protein KF886_05910 [Candidatus Hydrogenedentes bacterium]|nr:hypothetical protein [Candidatus Hydrogenedentota bacterium]
MRRNGRTLFAYCGVILAAALFAGCGADQGATAPGPEDAAPAPEAPAAPDGPDPAPDTDADNPVDTPVEEVADGDFEFTVRQSAPAYSPGKTLTVTVTMAYSGAEPVTALALETALPPGWQYAGVAGELRPSVEPPAGMRRELTFVWINVPEFPATFEFALDAPDTATDPAPLVTRARYRGLGSEKQSNSDTLHVDPAP